MTLVADARPSERAKFIQNTYAHLAGAVAAFIILEIAIVRSPIAEMMVNVLVSNRYMWMAFLGAFVLLGWLARGLASKTTSVESQYLGLGLYVTAEALIFAPMLYIASKISPDVLPTAAILTGLLFAGLTAIVFTTKKDFSFLHSILTIGGFIAMGLIICSVIFGFSLGLLFSVVMVAFASAAILYDTSNIMHHYSVDQHVGASLELFASVALLFWYILQILMRLSSRN
jgi:uncharacterized protein